MPESYDPLMKAKGVCYTSQVVISFGWCDAASLRPYQFAKSLCACTVN